MSDDVVAVRVDQAMFGEDRSGHALLATTTSQSLGQILAPRLDLPDQPPLGVSWRGFVSGFPFKDRYILARTEPDRQAPRSGMVFSHALVSPLEQMIELIDLRPFFARLGFQRPKIMSLAPLDITVSCTPSIMSPALIPAANIFGVRGTLPVVYLGSEGFETLVESLWATLWPEMRRGFAFRLSFSSQDLVELPRPALVCTPENLSHRWDSKRIVDINNQTLSTGLATALLAGNLAGNSLLQFGRQLGLQPATFPELLELERAQQLAAKNDNAFESRLAAVRVIAKLALGANQGVEIKSRLQRALEDAVRRMSSNEFLMLRNLNLAGFPEPKRLWKAVAKWLSVHCFPPTDDLSLRQALCDAKRIPNAVEEWRFAVWEGIDAVARRNEPLLAAAFWRWVSDDVNLIDTLIDRFDSHPRLDVILADATPRELKDAVSRKVLSRMACTQWRHSHAATAAVALGLEKAVRRQLSFDPETADDHPLRRMTRKALPDQLIALAIRFGDSRLVALAATAAAIRPSLLSRVDVTTMVGRKIWAGALESNDNAWSGPAEPQGALFRLLESVLKGKRVVPQLLVLLSRTPLADLSNFPKRHTIWGCLSIEARSGFLSATADGWLAGLAQGDIRHVPEPELEQRILEPKRLSSFLESCVGQNIDHGAQLFSILPNVSENHFVVWLGQVLDSNKGLSVNTVKHLGRVVVAYAWPKALEILIQQFRNGRHDLIPALRICGSMLSVWDKFRFGITSLTKSDKWDLFEEVAVELYPSGPDQDELWERAGGRNGDLEKQGTGAARWKVVLSKVSRGRNPRPARLLRVMLEDYPLNDRLRFLADDHEFGGSQF